VGFGVTVGVAVGVGVLVGLGVGVFVGLGIGVGVGGGKQFTPLILSLSRVGEEKITNGPVPSGDLPYDLFSPGP
jgi:hypothetical protein